MKEKTKKIIKVLGVVGIIFLSVFVVTTQYQISEINKREEERQPLFLKVFADKTEGLLPLSVNFSALVDYYQGDLKYEWDFGNGNTSREKTPIAVYEADGKYVCSLKITDGEGNTKTDYINIIAKRNKPPLVILKINQNTISRKFNWMSLLPFMPFIRAAKYSGNHQQVLDWIEERKGPNAFGKGRLVVTAQISDPEDDEIVSYEWIEQTAGALVTASGEEIIPTHPLSGNESVTIPELYCWIDTKYVVTLTVTDSAGNKATGNIGFTVSKSSTITKINEKKNLLTALFITTVPQITNKIWNLFPKINEKGTAFLDEYWLDLPPLIQQLIAFGLETFKIDYDPPLPKADLEASEISDLNFSSSVNETGIVQMNATIKREITVSNIDSENTAKNIYLSLKEPFSNEEGLADEIETEGITIELNAGVHTDKLFYKGKYTKWKNCYKIEELNPGDTSNLEISFFLKEGAEFQKGTYQCRLYMYQESSLDKEEYVDAIPFTIII